MPKVLSDDDLLILLETFKNGLVSRATGGDYDEEEEYISDLNAQLLELQFKTVHSSSQNSWIMPKVEGNILSIQL